jgi:hypothetical protein
VPKFWRALFMVQLMERRIIHELRWEVEGRREGGE